MRPSALLADLVEDVFRHEDGDVDGDGPADAAVGGYHGLWLLTGTTGGDQVADLHVVVDNRAGHRERSVRLAGRDPERKIGFAFQKAEMWVPPGAERATRARLHAPLPHPGEQATRSFTVAAGEVGVERGGEVRDVHGTVTAVSTVGPLADR